MVNLLVDDAERETLSRLVQTMPDIILTDRQMCDFELLVTGAFSPLDRFMDRRDYESVLDDMRLASGQIWPLPVCLDISEARARNLEIGQSLSLRDGEGFPLGVLELDDIWPVPAEKEAEALYNGCSSTHPGREQMLDLKGRYYIGGRVKALNLPVHTDFNAMRLSPGQVRERLRQLGWKRVVGFQTGAPIHRPQFELTVQAMRKADANLLLFALTGIPKPGDFDHYTRMRCYQKVGEHYPEGSHLINLLPLSSRAAGLREAILHLIIGKNYGCTHFVIGHDHAAVSSWVTAVQPLVSEAGKEIGIEPVTFEKMVYLPFEDEFKLETEVGANQKTLSVSNNDIRDLIRRGKNVPEWASFPEVIRELNRSYPAPARQGFTLFLTGLSGAGKSTIAKMLYARFMEIGTRPVTLLDGDIVRRNLSSELNFSKEHRDINVKRIGFVASEITKNRGIAICAPIAPYERTRNDIRRSIERYGGFIEIHVSTPIAECERRDRKGMYARARAGLLKGFTGVDDPYEPPVAPELSIDTTHITPEEAVRAILDHLKNEGFVG